MLTILEGLVNKELELDKVLLEDEVLRLVVVELTGEDSVDWKMLLLGPSELVLPLMAIEPEAENPTESDMARATSAVASRPRSRAVQSIADDSDRKNDGRELA